ncbi:MAG: methionyl-tRNA formyltransferase [Oscillospiraceae bacterium]|nr:methionyl-tRNA formyltransferase [Oscillospiraceae bacterium]
MKVVFMGTPDFAVPCLQRLIADGHDVTGVFTQPDKPKGRGNVIAAPPVKEEALKNGIAVYQPRSMRDGEALEILREITPELIVVVAFGKILPKEILELPRFGCINIHASLLPKYRGAAPVQWAVLNGESVTGVTSMQMDEGLDTGDILIKAQTEIGENETAGDVLERLSCLGADVLSKTLSALTDGSLRPEKQDSSQSTHAPMLAKELCPIDWTRSAREIHNQIRGLSPWPVATAVIYGKKVKIHESKLCGLTGGNLGEIMESGGRLIVSCGNFECLEIITVQAEGKKAMNAADFLRGLRN